MNTHVFGGQGKTTLLTQQFLEVTKTGGALFVDPNGQAADTILSLFPKRALVIDPTDIERPVGFNVLYDVRNKPLLASLLLSTVKAIWNYEKIPTPTLDRVLYNALAALLEFRGATLLHVEPMLTDKSFRERVLDGVSDPVLLRKWAYWSRRKEKEWDQLISSTENKAGEFSEDPRIRNIIGQPETTFDLRQLLAEQTSIILRLPQSQLGQKTTLFGSLFLAYFLSVAYERRGLIPYSVFIDDVQHFDTPIIRHLLENGRKHSLNVTASNQYLGQLSPELRSSLIGNCERRMMFRCGIEDSRYLHQTLPENNTLPFLHELPRYQAIVADGLELTELMTKQTPKGNRNRARKLVAQSRQRYGRSRVKIERVIAAL